ncbi:MADD-like protein [Mya arenaria]|uniref:MADD-like protein n=1 Tax=Mya arenaria TaxID=6604 RepID=A0ABY7DTZ0_MYAAR|nr:MADD-like protein [Mya arenaria]
MYEITTTADWGKPIKGPELGGEFPVQDVKSGQGGLLQVCMEGIGLLLANSKSFIELNRIKKCFTLKGEIFILEEFDAKSKQVIQHRFKSRLAETIPMTVHRIITVQVAKIEQQIRQQQETLRDAGSRLIRYAMLCYVCFRTSQQGMNYESINANKLDQNRVAHSVGLFKTELSDSYICMR